MPASKEKEITVGKFSASNGVTWNPKIIHHQPKRKVAKRKGSPASRVDAQDVAEAERRLSNGQDRTIPFRPSR